MDASSTPRMTREQKAALEPYAALLARLIDRVEALPATHLQNLVEAARAASTGNCGWATYRVAQLIAPIAEAELLRRERAKPRTPEGTK